MWFLHFNFKFYNAIYYHLTDIIYSSSIKHGIYIIAASKYFLYGLFYFIKVKKPTWLDCMLIKILVHKKYLYVRTLHTKHHQLILDTSEVLLYVDITLNTITYHYVPGAYLRINILTLSRTRYECQIFKL